MLQALEAEQRTNLIFNRDYNREFRDNGKEHGNYHSIMGYFKVTANISRNI